MPDRRTHGADTRERPEREVLDARTVRLGRESPNQAQARRGIRRWPSRPWFARSRPPARSRASVWSILGVGCGGLVIVAVAWPLLFSDATFDVDWQMHLWYLWHQSLAIQANGTPSLFVHYSHSVFYPEYAFYGGGLYALAGILSLLLGNAPLQTYILTYCVGFTAAYGGWYWLARMAHIHDWTAHVPGAVFITSASYLTIIYGRGEWQEFIGVSAIPLLAAAGISVLRSERLRFWPALALAGGATTFFAGHNMTMLWGSTFLAVTGIGLLACVPAARRLVRRRGALYATGLISAGLLANTWFLLPALAYSSHTLIGSGYRDGAHLWSEVLRRFMPMVKAEHLFTLSRTAGTGLYEANRVFALPVLAMVWIVFSAAILVRTGARGPWLRTLAVLAAMTTAFAIAMTHAGLVLALPLPYRILQFSSRLESYVLLGISGSLLAALSLTNDSENRAARLWRWALIPVLLVTAIGVYEQLDALPDNASRKQVLRSSISPKPVGVKAPMALEDYEDASIPVLVGSERNLKKVRFPPASIHGDSTTLTVDARAGEPLLSNLSVVPELVHVTGAKIVGLDREGNDVLVTDPNGPTETITVSPASTAPVVVGRLLSLLAWIALGVGFVALATRRVLDLRKADDG